MTGKPKGSPLKMTPRGTVIVSFEVTPEMHQRFMAAAQERGVSATWLFNRMAETYLPLLKPVDEWDVFDL